MPSNDFVEIGFVEDFFVESGPHVGLRRVVVVVPPEQRVAAVPHEQRLVAVPFEARVAQVERESR